MRLGISSSLRHDDAAEWAKKHKELGLEAVNFPLTCEDDETLVNEYVKEARANNLILAEVGIWRNTLAHNPDKREEEIRYAIKQLELADRIGAACCVNILGSRGSRWDGACKENYSKETWKLVVETIQKIIDAASPQNTFFTIEPMPWMYPMNPEEYLRLMEDVDRKQFAVHLDVFNWITSPRRYFFNEEFIDECFAKLGDRIKSCHLKDVRLEEGYTVFLRETYPGNGGINIRHLIEVAERYDKNMPFIIEHLDSDEEYIESVRYVRNLEKDSMKKRGEVCCGLC